MPDPPVASSHAVAAACAVPARAATVRLGAAVALLVSVIAPACSVDLGLDVKRFACTTDAECAAGYVCRPAEVEPETWVCIAGDASTEFGCISDEFCAGQLSATQCGEPRCLQGACALAPLSDIPCDDADACTTGDACAEGACEGAPVLCPAIDACHLDGACDPATGSCSAPLQDDGEPCDDEDPCTKVDACAGGACVGSACECRADVECEGVVVPGPCEVAVCLDYACALMADPDREAQPCDDQDPCTVEDTCDGATCAGAPMDCGDLDGPCSTGVCVDGSCAPEHANAGSDCSLEDPCWLAASCVEGGACVGLTWDTAECGCNDDEACGAAAAPPCFEGVCDLENHACVSQPIPDLPCDDESPCTQDDRCDELGLCAGKAYTCPEAPACMSQTCLGDGSCTDPTLDAEYCFIADQCVSAGASPPGDDCLACDPEQTTGAWSQREDGSACDLDDTPCTADVCEGGACSAGPPACEDGLECTDDACSPSAEDPALPSCEHAVVPEWCAVGDQCVPLGVSDPADPCRWCDPSSDPHAWTPLEDGADCGDGGGCVWGACVFPTEMEVIVPFGATGLAKKASIGCGTLGCAEKVCRCNEPLADQPTTFAPFSVDRHEVTAAQYRLCKARGGCGAGTYGLGSSFKTFHDAERAEHPMNFLKWQDASTYCQALAPARRLCTEAEWEHAARGSCADYAETEAQCRDDARIYPWGNELAPGSGADYAVFAAESTEPVGGKPEPEHTSVLGLSGNVAEWVVDDYSEEWPLATPVSCLATADTPCGEQAMGAAGDKVVRGASFNDEDVLLLRAAARRGEIESKTAAWIGFRCCRDEGGP